MSISKVRSGISTPRVALRLLGPPAILVDGEAVRGAPQKAEALLFLLAVSGRSWLRADLAELLWDDRSAPGRQSLRVALTKIPKPVETVLARDAERLALLATETDLTGWLARCASVRRQAGGDDLDQCDALLGELAGWPGHLLEGFEIDAPGFDDWCYAERQRVQREWQTAVLEAVARVAPAGRWRGAEQALTRLLDLDPGHETAHRWLIQCHLANGSPEAARGQYELCKRQLATLLGARPGAATQALIDALGAKPGRVEVVAPAAGAAPPAVASESTAAIRAIPNNLGQQVNSFVGRGREMADVKALLRQHRLVTLFGTGGIGKTRLSVQVAAAVLDDHPDGAWFVDLAPISDPRLVAQAVASLLQVREAPGRPVIEALEQHVRDCELLLILDNCEHLVDAAADLARRLMRAGADVTVLATSRECLRIAGEAAYQVPTLAVADSGPEDKALLESDAVRLFIDRACAARADFRLALTQARLAADLCRRLDGIPLAIELAAARVRSMSLEAIAARLQDRFGLPPGGERGNPARQQTLQTLIDWSFDLLDEDEATLFRRLAIFARGWTVAAAEAVAGFDRIAADRMLDVLSRLVEKSLVAWDSETDRYRLLETVRHYASGKLDASADGEVVRRRHVEYYLTLAETARPKLAGPEQAEGLAQLDMERENLGVAFAQSALLAESAALGARLVHALRPYWISRGLMTVGLEGAMEVLSRPGLAALRQQLCGTLFGAGQLCLFAGRCDEARSYLAKALDVAREIGDGNWIAGILQPLGMTCYDQGDLAAAEAYLKEAVVLAEKQGDARETSAAYNAMAQLLRLQDRAKDAASLYERALALATATGDREFSANFLLNLAITSVVLGDLDGAKDRLRDALRVGGAIGSQPVGQSAVEVCAGLAAATGDWPFAARLFGAAEAQISRTGMTRDRADQAFMDPLILLAREALGVDKFAHLQRQGGSLELSTALSEVDRWLGCRPLPGAATC